MEMPQENSLFDSLAIGKYRTIKNIEPLQQFENKEENLMTLKLNR